MADDGDLGLDHNALFAGFTSVTAHARTLSEDSLISPRGGNFAPIPEHEPLPSVDIWSLEYTTPPYESLICTICVTVLVEPVQLPCEHIFCAECLETHFDAITSELKNCPKCRRPIEPETDVSPAPRIIKQMLDDLIVKCPNISCVAELPRYTIQDHVDRYCDFTYVQCPHGDCEVQIQRKRGAERCLHKWQKCEYCAQQVMEADMGIHLETCEKSAQDCRYCHLSIPRVRAVLHEDDECEYSERTCPGQSLGCGFRDLRSHTAEHAKSCPLALINGRLESDAHARKKSVQELEAQVTAQAHRLADMDKLISKVNILEHGMDRIRGVLFDEDGKPRLPSTSIPTLTDIELTSQDAQHLKAELDQHLHHQDEVNAVHFSRIEELDARMQMWLTNENIRWQQDLLAIGSAVSAVRTQLNALATLSMRPSAILARNSISTASPATAAAAAMAARNADADEGRSAGFADLPFRRMSAQNADPKL